MRQESQWGGVQHRQGNSAKAGFVTISKLVVNDVRISDQAFRLYAVLQTFAISSTNCWPSQYRLALQMRCNERTVRNALRELERLGLVATKRQATVPPRNLYHLEPLDDVYDESVILWESSIRTTKQLETLLGVGGAASQSDREHETYEPAQELTPERVEHLRKFFNSPNKTSLSDLNQTDSSGSKQTDSSVEVEEDLKEKKEEYTLSPRPSASGRVSNPPALDSEEENPAGPPRRKWGKRTEHPGEEEFGADGSAGKPRGRKSPRAKEDAEEDSAPPPPPRKLVKLPDPRASLHKAVPTSENLGARSVAKRVEEPEDTRPIELFTFWQKEVFACHGIRAGTNATRRYTAKELQTAKRILNTHGKGGPAAVELIKQAVRLAIWDWQAAQDHQTFQWWAKQAAIPTMREIEQLVGSLQEFLGTGITTRTHRVSPFYNRFVSPPPVVTLDPRQEAIERLAKREQKSKAGIIREVSDGRDISAEIAAVQAERAAAGGAGVAG